MVQSRTFTLEAATLKVIELKRAGHLHARFDHQRNRKTGRPTGRFIVTPGPQEDVPMRVLRHHQKEKSCV